MFPDELEKESAVQKAYDGFPSGKGKLEGTRHRVCGITTTIITACAGSPSIIPSSGHWTVRCTLGNLLGIKGMVTLMQKFDFVSYATCHTFRIIDKVLLINLCEDSYKKVGLNGTRAPNGGYFVKVNLKGKSSLSEKVLSALCRMPITENVVAVDGGDDDGDVIPKGAVTGWSQHHSRRVTTTSVMCPFRPDVSSALKRDREMGESQFDQFSEWLAASLLGGSPHPSGFPLLPKGASTLNISVVEGVFSSSMVRNHISRCSDSPCRWAFVDTQSTCLSPWKSAPMSLPPLKLGVGVQYLLSSGREGEGKLIQQHVVSSTGDNIDAT